MFLLIIIIPTALAVPQIISEESTLKFIDFSYAHTVGVPIQFILEKAINADCNSYNAKITDENGNFILGWGEEISCDPDSVPNPVQTKIGYKENKPIIINESGKYYLEVEFVDAFTKQEFVVRQNHGGVNIANTDYSDSQKFPPPLKQVKDGVPINLIKCNESLQLEWKLDLQPICVTSEIAGELIKRGAIKLRLGMPAEEITQERLCVWYPENPLIQRHCDWETNILFTFKDEGLVPAYDEILRLYAMEKRQLFRDFQFDTQEKYGSEHMWELLPSHYRGYDYHRDALEFGIHHEVFDEESAPKYVKFIRSIVGENVNLTVRPAYPIIPQSFTTGELENEN
ncbi:hypothetical protein [Nitrosarchaeum sp.]|uniref:hypothetical protein n=1 Tax=Nitrosarchaeum sp. TaxID=2026886 RepID=UPI002623C447|nr:hypothetical protein [Nitrosarchaeum sp.]